MAPRQLFLLAVGAAAALTVAAAGAVPAAPVPDEAPTGATARFDRVNEVLSGGGSMAATVVPSSKMELAATGMAAEKVPSFASETVPTGAAGTKVGVVSRMSAEKVPPSTGATTAEVTTAVRVADAGGAGAPDVSLTGVASTRVISEAIVDGIIRSEARVATTYSGLVSSILRRLARGRLNGRTLSSQYNIVMIRESFVRSTTFRGIIYFSRWRFEGRIYRVWIFRSGVLRHVPTSLTNFGFLANKRTVRSGVVAFRAP